MVVLAAGLVAQVAYYVPSCVLISVAIELWAAWDFLVDFGLVELVQTQIVSAETSFQKLLDMIPRYKGEWFEELPNPVEYKNINPTSNHWVEVSE